MRRADRREVCSAERAEEEVGTRASLRFDLRMRLRWRIRLCTLPYPPLLGVRSCICCRDASLDVVLYRCSCLELVERKRKEREGV